MATSTDARAARPGTPMRIGELARAAGVAPSALRFYEAEGLLGPGGRTASGYRVYGPEAAGRVEFIRRAKALGLTLADIRRLVATDHPDRAAERDAVRHTVAHRLAELRTRVAELNALQGDLEALYTRLLRAEPPACGHVGDCACWLPTEEEVRIMTEEIACCEPCCEDEDCCENGVRCC